MAKNKEEVVEVVKEEPVKKVVLPAPVIREKLITFDQYCKLKKILPHHMLGMKAYVKNINKNRTRTGWDEIFKSY